MQDPLVEFAANFTMSLLSNLDVCQLSDNIDHQDKPGASFAIAALSFFMVVRVGMENYQNRRKEEVQIKELKALTEEAEEQNQQLKEQNEDNEALLEALREKIEQLETVKRQNQLKLQEQLIKLGIEKTQSPIDNRSSKNTTGLTRTFLSQINNYPKQFFSNSSMLPTLEMFPSSIINGKKKISSLISLLKQSNDEAALMLQDNEIEQTATETLEKADEFLHLQTTGTKR